MPIIILLILIIACIVAGIAGGVYFYNYAFSTVSGKKTPGNPDDQGSEKAEYDNSFFDTVKSAGNYEDVYMQSRDGLLLHGIVVEECDLVVGTPSRYQSGKWAVLCHGYTGKAANMSSFAEIFASLGFSILSVDLRGHGDSEGKYRGMGWHDSFDLMEWIQFLESHYTVTDIALYGISMGGATVMNAAGHNLPESVKVIVEDCGYSSIKDEMKYNMKLRYNLPSFPIMNFFSLVTKKRAGFSVLKDGDTVKQLKKSNIPILFIHGDEDTFVPFSMFGKVYKAASGPKEKFVVTGAGHGKSFTLDPEGYRNAIYSFLYKYIHI